MRYQLHQGDSRELLKLLADNSVDSIVCDPPYHLTTGKKGGTGPASVNLESPYGRARVGTGFMGMSWDGGQVAHDPALWAEALRVAKPGAWLVAFGGTRTFHRLACAIEDAGWELRDSPLRGHMHQPEDCPWLHGWMFGTGFPKSHNGDWGGTALKPAWEPIVLARKPLIGTVEENWREHGTGALNIDACRIDWQGEDGSAARKAMGYSEAAKKAMGSVVADASPTGFSGDVKGTDSTGGRWPANLVHDGSPEVVALFPSEAGAFAPVRGTEPSAAVAQVYGERERVLGAFHGDTGSAARFFYCAKASREDRNEGCEQLPLRGSLKFDPTSAIANDGRRGDGVAANHHPTVKPTDLMRWLVRLVTPSGGTVLDLFTGSGSTGKAAILEGMRFIGFDLDRDENGSPLGYLDIARARIEFALRQGHQPSLLVEEA